ncbi:MAG: hypothetical protein IAF38_16760 [Bacteroidia bacterium]|nr:hypothetical protein [Bacteroidia bacterium]
MKRFALLFCWLIGFYCSSQNLQLEFTYNKQLSLLRFVKTLRRPNGAFINEKTYLDSKYNNEASKKRITALEKLNLEARIAYEGFPETRMAGRGVYDLLIIAASESNDLKDFEKRINGILPQQEQSVLIETLNYFEPVYQELIWKPCEEKFLLKVNELKGRTVTQVRKNELQAAFAGGNQLNYLFGNIAAFYGAKWDRAVPFKVFLYPVSGKSGATSAQPYGNILVADLLTEEKDIPGFLGVVYHEMSHVLFSEQPVELQTKIDSLFLNNPSPYRNYAYHWFNECMATVCGNGWANENLTGKIDSAEWYNNAYINKFAKAVYPFAKTYLASSKKMDAVFIEQCITQFQKTFPDALQETDNLFTFFNMACDAEDPNPVFGGMYKFFQGRNCNSSFPIDEETISKVEKSVYTRIYFITHDNAETITALNKKIGGIKIPKEKRSFAYYFLSEAKNPYVIVSVNSSAESEKIFKTLFEKKTFLKSEKLIVF